MRIWIRLAEQDNKLALSQLTKWPLPVCCDLFHVFIIMAVDMRTLTGHKYTCTVTEERREGQRDKHSYHLKKENLKDILLSSCLTHQYTHVVFNSCSQNKYVSCYEFGYITYWVITFDTISTYYVVYYVLHSHIMQSASSNK